MGIICSFITVVCVIFLLGGFSLGLNLLLFLNAHKWVVSIVLFTLLWLAFNAHAKGESDPKERALTRCVPFSFIPCWSLIISVLPDILSLTGSRLFACIWIETPIAICLGVGAGILVNVLAGRLDEPEGIIPVSIVGNILAALVLCNIGI